MSDEDFESDSGEDEESSEADFLGARVFCFAVAGLPSFGPDELLSEEGEEEKTGLLLILFRFLADFAVMIRLESSLKFRGGGML